MSLARENDPKHVSDVLGEFFRRSGMQRSLRRAEAVLLWPRVAGVEVARFSSARAVRDGVLYVDVDDSETAMHLSLQRRRFLAVYHDTYKVTSVKEIRFQAGRAARGKDTSEPDDEAAASVPGPAPDPQELTQLARELESLQLGEEVTGMLMTTGRSLLALRARQRAAGHTACPTCGALHPGLSEALTPREAALAGRDASGYELPDRELCEACRRYAADAKVKAAAQVLALDPLRQTPSLSDTERAVALRLARSRLQHELEVAFPLALSDPGRKGEMEALALRLASLVAGKPEDELTDTDFEVVPARYRRFLDLFGPEPR